MPGTKWGLILGAMGLLGLSSSLIFPVIFAHSSEALPARMLWVVPPQPRSPAGAALYQARRYRTRAKIAVNERRDMLEQWDPEAVPGFDPEVWRLELMAAEPDLARARAAAHRAAGLATTTSEASSAAELMSLIDHEAGHHAAELHWARELVRLRPESEDSRMVLRRALRCPRQNRPAGMILHVWSEPGPVDR